MPVQAPLQGRADVNTTPLHHAAGTAAEDAAARADVVMVQNADGRTLKLGQRGVAAGRRQQQEVPAC